MEQLSPSGSELGGGVPIPASSHIIFLYERLTASSNTPEWEHRHPTLFRYVELVPRMSSSRRAGAENRMNIRMNKSIVRPMVERVRMRTGAKSGAISRWPGVKYARWLGTELG